MTQRFAHAFVMLFALTSVAQADPQLNPFSYRLKVPAGATSCADHAGSVAASFAAGTRTKSKGVTGACESRQTLADHGTQYAIDVIVVNYQADSELTPARSVYGANAFMNVGEQGAGVFATYADCLTQLAVQQPLFVKETGVAPVVAYCSASTQQEFFPGFSLTIESFGDLARRLYTYSEDGIGVPTDDHSQVIHAALFALQSAGADIAWSDNSRVFYYNDGDINVAAENLGMFEDPAQCTSQLAQAQAIYTAAGLAGVTAFCNALAPVPGHTFSVLTAVGAGPDEVSDLEGDRYDSFEECTGDLARVLKNATSNGRTVLGGLCSPNQAGSGGFNVHVFSSIN